MRMPNYLSELACSAWRKFDIVIFAVTKRLKTESTKEHAAVPISPARKVQRRFDSPRCGGSFIMRSIAGPPVRRKRRTSTAAMVRKATLSGTGGGAELEFQVPVFDFGEARLRQASEAYLQAFNRLQESVVNVRSEAREAYQRYRSSYEIAGEYRTKVLPARKTISDESTLRYGAMQIDVFSLLSEAQQRISASVAATQAQENFWLANADLDAAIIGGGQGDDHVAAPSAPTPDPAANE
jgi:hypothetical protein